MRFSRRVQGWRRTSECNSSETQLVERTDECRRRAAPDGRTLRLPASPDELCADARPCGAATVGPPGSVRRPAVEGMPDVEERRVRTVPISRSTWINRVVTRPVGETERYTARSPARQPMESCPIVTVRLLLLRNNDQAASGTSWKPRARASLRRRRSRRLRS